MTSASRGFPSVAAGLLAGLVAAQVVGTALVFRSNRSLLERMIALQQSGYLTLPNSHVMARLEQWGPAFFGALFFTATIGVLISATTLATVRFANHSFPEKAIAVLLLLWTVFLIHVNSAGFNLAGTLFWVMTPPIVWRFASKDDRKALPAKTVLIHSVALALFVGPWATRMDAGLFSDIRNELLLGNPAGRAMNEFYYRYTLFAAEVFKSLDQKTQRACHLFSPPEQEMDLADIRRKLANRDWLTVGPLSPADLNVTVTADAVSMRTPSGQEVLQADKRTFRRDISDWLERYAAKVDRHAPLRMQTFAGLLLSVVSAVYGIGFGLAMAVLRPFRIVRHRVAAGLCVLASWLVFGLAGDVPALDRPAIGAALKSGDTAARIHALRQIARHRLEAADFEGVLRSVRSESMEERFWLAGALRFSKHPETFRALLELLDDSRINVACRAYGAVGFRGGPGALEAVISRYPRIKEWYVQVYAYKALRRLGWRQNASAALN